ncbi:hypothetical protein [Tenacibaculum maritimum]|uniref:hypothetical protein n=1 Tax=Tenacibaculum maritimum TaxID=107401 RepID=UPI00042A0C0F|nr:hypothetical protein [Tenacibaculum maritimum]CAA0157381.1 conserved hypothetical protein [Tenacibaculum maritimum]CAA0203995.1 conserved hypothetical protein [Tenacibaculum maritimum]
MKNFEKFVDKTVVKWRSEKKNVLESYGLGGIIESNREAGDLAEDYILRKIKNLSQNYKAKKSKGSQSPSDIFAVANRGRFWHIMLIQVKSSENKNHIYNLNDEEVKILNSFAKFFKKELNSSELMKNYKKSSIVISTGYAGVHNDVKNNRRFLKDTKYYNSFKKNMSEYVGLDLLGKIMIAHRL